MEGIGEVARGFKGQEILVGICVSRWREGVLAMSEHVLGIASGETAGLGAEVQKMVSDFHWPSALMAVWSMPEMSRVVAPPEHRP